MEEINNDETTFSNHGKDHKDNTNTIHNSLERKTSSSYKMNKTILNILVGVGLTAFCIHLHTTTASTKWNNYTNTKSSSSSSFGNNNKHTKNQKQRRTDDASSITILPPFSSSILEGYETCTEFKDDIIKAGRYIVKEKIDIYRKNGMVDGPSPILMSIAGDSSSSESKAEGPPKEDSYGTNNQVEGVEEADVVQSDGRYIYTVYGSDVVVLDKEGGSIITRVTIPKLEAYPKNKNVVWDYERSYSFWSKSSMMVPNYIKKQLIRGLLLDESNGYLVVIVTVYNYGLDEKQKPIFIQGETTLVHTYAIYTNSSGDDLVLTLLKTNTLNGRYSNARSMTGNAYITSNTRIDTSQLTSLFDRHNTEYWFLSNDEYINSATTVMEEALPKFAQQLMMELLGSDEGMEDENACRFIVQLSFMQPAPLEEVESSSDKKTTQIFEQNAATNLLSSFAQILSFDMTQQSSSQVQLYNSQKISGIFLPSTDMDIYATSNTILLGARGYEAVPNKSYWNEYTYLVAFEFVNGAAVPSAVGKVQGYILNQFSMDYYNGFIRVATTTSEKWGELSMDDTKLNSFQSKKMKKKWGAIAPSTNQVYILKKEGSAYNIVGEVLDLGTTESIYSVRFLQDKGYVVTFRKTDPLYTLDLSQPYNPTVTGELKITGFSNYLHPIQEGSMLLAIGQEADEKTGRQLGSQISLFDVSDMSNPTLLHKTVIEGSSSDAQYDHHAFRYLPLSKVLIIPLYIYPSKNKEKEKLFDGFYIYSIDPIQGIQKIKQIVHADTSLIDFYNGCFSDAYLQPRSMVFQSNLITLKGHTIIHSGDVLEDDLKGEGIEWLMNFDALRFGGNDVCYDWFPWF